MDHQLGAGHDERAQPGPGPGHHDDLVGRRTVEHRLLGAVRTHPAAVGVAVVRTSSSRHRPFSATASVPVSSPAATSARNRACWSGSPSSPIAGANWVTVASQGLGTDGPTELLGHDGELDESEPEATVLLGDGEGRPVQLDHLVPDRGRSVWCS